MSKKSTLKNSIVYLSLEKGINGTITIILIPVMIHFIGVENYGFWGLLIGLIGYIQCLDLGISLSVERYVAYFTAKKDYESLERLLSSALTMMILIICTLTFPIIYGGEFVVRYLTKNSLNIPLLAVIFSIFPAIIISWVSIIFMGIPRGLQRFDITSKIQICGKCLFAFSLLVLLIFYRSLFSVIIAFNIQCLTVFILYIIKTRTLLPDIKFIKFSISLPILKQMITYGFKIQVSAFSFLINQQFDKFLLASFCNLTYVGYYDAASRIVFAVKDIPHFFVSVLTPRVSSLFAVNNKNEILSLFFRVTATLAIVGFVLSGLMFINSRHIIFLILKTNSNRFSVIVFGTLSIAAVWQSMAAGAVYVARGLGKTQIEMNTTILVLIINVISSIALFSIFSYQGVVFGTAIAMIFAPVICYIMMCRNFGTSFVKFMHHSFSIPFFTFCIAVFSSLFITEILNVDTFLWIAVILKSILFIAVTHLIYSLSRYEPYHQLCLFGVAIFKNRSLGKAMTSKKNK